MRFDDLLNECCAGQAAARLVRHCVFWNAETRDEG